MSATAEHQVTSAQLTQWAAKAAEDAVEWAKGVRTWPTLEVLDAYAAGIRRGYEDAYLAFVRHGLMRECRYA